LAAVGVPLSYIAASANIPLYVNTAMLVATPIDGSHYFIDVLAGIALGALSLTVARAMAARATSHLAPHAGEMAQSAQA
jgi:hypothetical protein